MKPEPILELESIDQRLSSYTFLIILLALTIFSIFISLWLAILFFSGAIGSIAIIRKCRYKVRYLNSSKTISKLYANGNVERISLLENGGLKLYRKFRREKYVVQATNSKTRLDLLETHNYDQALSLIRKLEAATNIKPFIGAHLWKLDTPEITLNNEQYYELARTQASKEKTTTISSKQHTPPSKPDATSEREVIHENEISVTGITEPVQFPLQSTPKATSQQGTMSAKDIAIAKITIAWAALFIAAGCYGLATGQYYIPSKHSGLITGGEAYPLSAFTMLLGVAVAAPAALSLSGFNIEKHKKAFLIIQYSFVAAILYLTFRKFL